MYSQSPFVMTVQKVEAHRRNWAGEERLPLDGGYIM
jgi:hypothetical protein